MLFHGIRQRADAGRPQAAGNPDHGERALRQGRQGLGISHIELKTEGNVPGVDEATFKRLAEEAKQNCPVSKALAATPITLQATLKSGVTA
jgi:organic hydroperoxide reductase OsmC/OhrA